VRHRTTQSPTASKTSTVAATVILATTSALPEGSTHDWLIKETGDEHTSMVDLGIASGSSCRIQLTVVRTNPMTGIISTDTDEGTWLGLTEMEQDARSLEGVKSTCDA
jgi:hypothetical protein